MNLAHVNSGYFFNEVDQHSLISKPTCEDLLAMGRFEVQNFRGIRGESIQISTRSDTETSAGLLLHQAKFLCFFEGSPA